MGKYGKYCELKALLLVSPEKRVVGPLRLLSLSLSLFRKTGNHGTKTNFYIQFKGTQNTINLPLSRTGHCGNLLLKLGFLGSTVLGRRLLISAFTTSYDAKKKDKPDKGVTVEGDAGEGAGGELA